MKVKMLTGMAGHDLSLAPGDVYDCDDEEGARLIEAGHAVPDDAKTTERAVKKGPAETR